MPGGSGELERGRAAYAAEAWATACDAFARADAGGELVEGDDLELLARAAYMLGRDDSCVEVQERAHDAHLAAGNIERAIRCTFWIGHNLMFRGQTALGLGWFGRGQRLVEELGRDCGARAYLLVPQWLEQFARGAYEAAYAIAVEAADIAARFGDDDLMWLARDDQGSALLRQGRVEEGRRLIDELLVIAASGRLSPVVTGIVYCNTISFCTDVFEVKRAAEWTDALTVWCERQPEMIAHNGLCLVHRAEVMQRRGAWPDALAEAERAAERFTDGVLNQLALGGGAYRRGEILRLCGEFDAAELAYREANRFGYEPQPGIALLRLAEERADAAEASIRRAIGERTQPLERARLLPAYVQIMIATGHLERAAAASRELDEIAATHVTEALVAMAAHAEGAVALARGDAAAALPPLRRALRLWLDLGGRYESAEVRLLIAEACAGLDDCDAAIFERDAAREIFVSLGAAPDIARLDAPTPGRGSTVAHGLSDRELQVLRLVAAGRTNREVAGTLVLSEHTVRRHLQNIFVKLGVSSRTAAGAYAYEHGLVD